MSNKSNEEQASSDEIICKWSISTSLYETPEEILLQLVEWLNKITGVTNITKEYQSIEFSCSEHFCTNTLKPELYSMINSVTINLHCCVNCYKEEKECWLWVWSINFKF